MFIKSPEADSCVFNEQRKSIPGYPDAFAHPVSPSLWMFCVISHEPSEFFLGEHKQISF